MSDTKINESHTAVSPAGTFRPRTLDQNGTFAFTFDKPSTYKYLLNPSEDDGSNRCAANATASTWKGTTMRIQDIIKTKGTDVVSVSEDASISDAAKIMRRLQIGALVVLTTEGKLKGIMSERDIIVALAQCGRCALELHVRELTMLGGPVVHPAHSVIDAMQIMTERRARHLPVVDKGTVVALISIGDLVKARLNEKITENMVLQEIAGWPRAVVAGPPSVDEQQIKKRSFA